MVIRLGKRPDSCRIDRIQVFLFLSPLFLSLCLLQFARLNAKWIDGRTHHAPSKPDSRQISHETTVSLLHATCFVLTLLQPAAEVAAAQ
jgi:hypothetical protein